MKTEITDNEQVSTSSLEWTSNKDKYYGNPGGKTPQPVRKKKMPIDLNQNQFGKLFYPEKWWCICA